MTHTLIQVKAQFCYGLITREEARDKLEVAGFGEIEAQRLVRDWKQ